MSFFLRHNSNSITVISIVINIIIIESRNCLICYYSLELVRIANEYKCVFITNNNRYKNSQTEEENEREIKFINWMS